MLPEPQYHPPCGFERGVCFAIALDVALKLRQPVLGVALRQCRMLWATMPEATVDEDSDPLAREDDVGSPAAAQGGEIDPVAQPRGVHQPAHCEFGLGVPAAIRPH